MSVRGRKEGEGENVCKRERDKEREREDVFYSERERVGKRVSVRGGRRK